MIKNVETVSWYLHAIAQIIYDVQERGSKLDKNNQLFILEQVWKIKCYKLTMSLKTNQTAKKWFHNWV